MISGKIGIKILVVVAMLSFFSSCEEGGDVEEESNTVEKSILGVWTVKSGTVYAVNSKGETIVTATVRQGTFAHELLAGGKYIGHDYVGKTTETGNWVLENPQVNGKEFEAVLAISTPSTQASKGEIFIDSDGFQRFNLKAALVENKFQSINLFSKEYEAFPYEKSWIEYLFSKL